MLSIYFAHVDTQEFTKAIITTCEKRASCCFIINEELQKRYEYRLFLKSIIVSRESWTYELECQDMQQNEMHYLQIESFTQLKTYCSYNFTYKHIDQLSSYSGAWLQLDDEILQSIGNIAFFTGHTTFRLWQTKPYGINIPFIRESKELIYCDECYNKVAFHVVNNYCKEVNCQMIPLRMSMFEV